MGFDVMFYILESPKATMHQHLAITDYSNSDNARLAEPPKCGRCGRFIGMMVWCPPFQVEIETWGNEYGDIAFGPGYDLLVSERFMTMFKRAGLTGLQGFEKVDVIRTVRHGTLKKAGNPDYYRVEVVYSRATVDLALSGIEYGSADICEECRRGGNLRRVRRLVLEKGSWTGEDVFRPRGMRGIIMTSDRFNTWFNASRINNGILVPALEFSVDYTFGTTE